MQPIQIISRNHKTENLKYYLICLILVGRIKLTFENLVLNYRVLNMNADS